MKKREKKKFTKKETVMNEEYIRHILNIILRFGVLLRRTKENIHRLKGIYWIFMKYLHLNCLENL